MKRIILSEEERKNILNLYIKEDVGCPCEDGSTSEFCCSKQPNPLRVDDKPSAPKPDPTKVIELEQSISKAQRELELINRQRDEETKATQIKDLQNRFDSAYNKLLSPDFNAMSKIQRQELLNTKKTLELQLNKLKGMEVPTLNTTDKKTADQKATAWISVATGVLGLFTTLLSQIKKPKPTPPSL